MIIILEGPDGSGKTTLANKLSVTMNMPIIHNVAPKNEDDFNGMYDMYMNIVLDNGHAILDRCWYSEIVYGEILRGESAIDLNEMLYLEELISHQEGGMIIHCTDKLNMLWQRCQYRGEDLVTLKEDLGAIKKAYDNLFMEEEHILPVVNYSVGKGMLKL